MKRLVLVPLLLALSLFLAACPAAETPAPAATEAPAAEPVEAPTEAPAAEPTEEPMAEEAAEEMSDEMNIVETAISAGSFTTLVAAVEAA
ncbi:MAG: hypothetical protein KDD84_24095, partial [Caldilineaceae bacterium]|nr:hypothetical protein [Caldilineaceae bacterium]